MTLDSVLSTATTSMPQTPPTHTTGREREREGGREGGSV